MDYEDDVSIAHLILNSPPLVLIKACAKVACADFEVNLMGTIDLSLRISQRCEQT